MNKSSWYRLFGFGRIPRKLRPVLEAEGIVVADEGISGWFVAGNVHGPGKRYFRRAEGFAGCLVITRKRIVCYSFWKRQINIAVDHPRIDRLRAAVPRANTLHVAFESADFREHWSGEIAFRFNTAKARKFLDALRDAGVQ